MSARGAKLTRSPLIKADAQNWLLNGVLSAVVLVAFVVVLLLEAILQPVFLVLKNFSKPAKPPKVKR